MGERKEFAMKVHFMFDFRISLWLAIAAGICVSCSGTSEHKKFTDTPTSGEITIAVDESYKPLIQVQLDTFMKIYKYSNIRAKYLPESRVFEELMHNDSLRIAIVSRPLSKEEEEEFSNRKIIPRVNKIAIDAVTFVVNKNNRDSLIRYEQLRDIISGKTHTWKELDPRAPADTIHIVFDNNGSGNTRYLRETFLGNNPLPPNCYAVDSNVAVIDYVHIHPSAIGVIGVNWVSDRQDPAVNEFLDKVSIVQVSPAAGSEFSGEYFKPYQAYIALKKYPLTREVLIISREGRNGLGTGFASFVAGDQGQRLVRLMGMLPATMPIRIVKIKQ